jgi:PPOX class probable F420-dependent enzyme
VIELPDQLKRIIDDRSIAHVATLDESGTPHVTAMWIMRDGDRIVLNTLEGRAKWHHLRRDPRIGISVTPPDETYLNYSIKGRVVDLRTSDGKEVIDRLAAKYLGEDEFPWLRDGDVRVTIVVEPTSVASNR